MDTFRKQETLKQYFDQSYGCAAFSSVAKGGLFFVGGAYGAGDIYKLQHGEAERVGKYRTSRFILCALALFYNIQPLYILFLNILSIYTIGLLIDY